MSSVDSRIVTMKFDNAQFEKGASTTISTLDRLKKAMGFEGAAKGLNDVQNAVDKTSFGPITGGIEKVNLKFMAMATIAITALTQITQKAMAVGAQVVKSLTIEPIKQGFDEYELKMGAIQTMMAGSGESLATVNDVLKQLNDYSDTTIYNFADMTSNMGKFTNAGVGLQDSADAIKGIANAAALSGANSNEASRAMYNFAQALSSGAVRLQDWKSIELANMATERFKQELMDSAVAAGTLKKNVDGTYTTIGGTDKVLTATKGFRDSLVDEWMTADVLTDTLQRYADVNTKVGKEATAAAQDVKTFSMMMSTLKETAGSGWAQTFELIFGNFEEAKKLWTGINDVIGGMLSDMSDKRNKLLTDWKALGGRDTLIDGLRAALEGIQSIMKPLSKAFRAIFPAATGQQLYDLTVKFKEFAERIKIGSDTAIKLRKTFEGFFAVFSIVGQIVKGFIGVIFDLVGAIGKGSGGFLDITAKIGTFLSSIDDALKNGTALTTFFDTLSAVLQKPIELIQALAGYIISVFSGFNSGAGDAVNGTFQRMADRLGPLAQLFQAVEDALGFISEKFKIAQAAMAPYIDMLKDALSSIGSALKEAFSGADINTILDMINTGLFAAIVIAVRKFLKDFKLDFGGGFVESIKDTFGALTGTLQAIQTNLKADTLMKIAGAVAMLVASIVALSLIDSKKLTNAMFAITAAFAQLVIAMAILTKIGGMTGFIKIPIITTAMILLSGALIILAGAMKMLSKLDWNEIAKGLAGTAGGMIILVFGAKALMKATGGMFTTGLGLLLLGLGLKLIASAIGNFAVYDWGQIGKGLATIAGILLVLSNTMRAMPKDLPFIAIGLIGIAAGMLLMANAITKMGAINFGQMLLGIGAIGIALNVISLSLAKMPPDMVFIAISLLGVAFALSKLADVVESLGGMSWPELGRGLTGLAAALIMVGVAMATLSGSVMGAVALSLMAVSIGLMVPALKALGNLSMKEIGVALIALAGAFTVLGIAAYFIGPLSVVVLALAGSLALLGAAVALTGLGILAFAKGLQILVTLGNAAAGAIATVLGAVISSIPQLFKAFADGIVQFTIAITKNAPVFANAMLVALNAILDTINKMAPKIANTMSMLLGLLLDKIVENSPKITSAGYKVLMDMLKKLNDNIYQIVDVATEIMIKFAKAIGDKSGKVADEGAKMIIKFINAVADSIRNNSKAMNDAGRNLTSAIITGMIGGITSGAAGVIQAIVGMAKSAIDAAKRILGIKSPSKEFETIGMFVSTGLAGGIDQYSSVATQSAEAMGTSLIDVFKSTLFDIDSLVGTGLNTQPVITPVVNTDEAEQKARYLAHLLSVPGLFVQSPSSTSFGAASYRKAASIAEDTPAIDDTRVSPDTATQGNTTINYEQNNYSPKALSEVEIYRQTKNQLSLTKGALAS